MKWGNKILTVNLTVGNQFANIRNKKFEYVFSLRTSFFLSRGGGGGVEVRKLLQQNFSRKVQWVANSEAQIKSSIIEHHFIKSFQWGQGNSESKQKKMYHCTQFKGLIEFDLQQFKYNYSKW